MSQIRVQLQLEAVPFFTHDCHSPGASVPAPIVLIRKVPLFEPAGVELAVAAPGLAAGKNIAQGFAVRRGLDSRFQQHLVHDSAAQSDFSSGLQFNLASAADIGKIRRRGPHVHDQYRAGEDIVSHLKMSGLAGTDQGGAGFGDDPHRRIARLLEDLAIALPLSPIPACGTAYIKTAVLPFNQASGHIEFSQDASREALNIADTGRIREKAALKTKASLHCVRCVAGLFTDQKFSCAQAGISRDEASHLPDGYHLRLGLLAFSQICDGTLGVAQVKSKIPIHFILPACALRTADAAAFTALRFLLSKILPQS